MFHYYKFSHAPYWTEREQNNKNTIKFSDENRHLLIIIVVLSVNTHVIISCRIKSCMHVHEWVYFMHELCIQYISGKH